MATSSLYYISALFGWVYTLCWSLSFYPQPLLNFRRCSTTGTTIDFPIINLLGFLAYFISNAAFLYSPQIRRAYALRHHGLTPTVQVNDLAFAAHAVVLSVVLLSQFMPAIWGFDKRGRSGVGARISNPILGVLVGSVIGVTVVAIIVLARQDEDPSIGWAWIDVVYAISYVKVVVTLTKFVPQVLINYRNRSTHGWAISQILLDLAGGVLSISQLGIDSYLQRDWSGVTGNPVKLALANISMFFDMIFIVQHYFLYRGKKAMVFAEGEQDPLLGRDRERIE